MKQSISPDETTKMDRIGVDFYLIAYAIARLEAIVYDMTYLFLK